MKERVTLQPITEEMIAERPYTVIVNSIWSFGYLVLCKNG